MGLNFIVGRLTKISAKILFVRFFLFSARVACLGRRGQVVRRTPIRPAQCVDRRVEVCSELVRAVVFNIVDVTYVMLNVKRTSMRVRPRRRP